MRFRLGLVMTLALVVGLALPAAAAQLEWSKETNRSACDVIGAPLVNVTQHVSGDVDSGFHGYWASDTYTRRIQLWESSPGEYCAVVRYSGTFDAEAGVESPGQVAASLLDGDEDGSFQGGYRATVTGDLLVDPTWAEHGTVGHFDYGCDFSGDCPGAVDWVAQYFGTDYDFQFEFWGWIYRAGRHGTWVNASTGSSGNID